MSLESLLENLSSARLLSLVSKKLPVSLISPVGVVRADLLEGAVNLSAAGSYIPIFCITGKVNSTVIIRIGFRLT